MYNVSTHVLLNYAIPVRMGGDTSMTPSPRTNIIGIVRFVDCNETKHQSIRSIHNEVVNIFCLVWKKYLQLSKTINKHAETI